MESYELKQVMFKKLKGLSDATFKFSKSLTAIMGVNGSGKTTVIHALACAYQPIDGGHSENHKFPEFFIPNTDSLWQGSEFTVTNDKTDINKNVTTITKKYSKVIDRWTPIYASRPKRNVYYIGIETCLPEIEKKTKQTIIKYSSKNMEDKISKKIIGEAAYILNINYDLLLDNIYKKKHFNGVELTTGLKYSSLSMGTGEQRTIKILTTVLSAEPYSLILIDEIDLLLHVSSLKRLIERLSDIAEKHNLQIVFTTHALEMAELVQYVTIQYISTLDLGNNTKRTFVYDNISNDIVLDLTGNSIHPLKIFVEDDLAMIIVNNTLRKLNMSSKTDVIKYGAIDNSFTLAAAKVLAKDDITNVLIVLDGDEYRTNAEKMKQIENKLTGTENDAKIKQKSALLILSQFNLPEKTSPEEFLHNILINYGDSKDPLVSESLKIKSVKDKHEYIYNLCKKLNIEESIIVNDIIKIVKDSSEWENYIDPINAWLLNRKNI